MINIYLPTFENIKITTKLAANSIKDELQYI